MQGFPGLIGLPGVKGSAGIPGLPGRDVIVPDLFPVDVIASVLNTTLKLMEKGQSCSEQAARSTILQMR